MQIKKVYLKPNSINAYHHPSGRNGAIVGVKLVTPPGADERLCYRLRWVGSPEEDYVPVSDVYEGIYNVVSTER